MNPAKPPRVVVVTRATEYEELLARHATRPQAAFFLNQRGLSIEQVETRHSQFTAALKDVLDAVPLKWRQVRVDRHDLNRFVVEPEDMVVAVGQDGLVANAAKYLSGQPVVGINPDPETYDGILVPHPAHQAGRLLAACASGHAAIENRTMVEASLDNGQTLLALNEVFVGHCSHQSARYRLRFRGDTERQSSSGLIVTTGTGATGWALSIHRQRRTDTVLPAPEEGRIAFFVREAFPSVATGVALAEGSIGEEEPLVVISEMNTGGTVFGDGIEDDRLDFAWGVGATIRISSTRLHLVQG